MDHRTRKWLLAGLTVVLALALVRAAVLRATSAESLERRLDRAVQQETGGLYRLSLGSTALAGLGSAFVAREVWFFPDTAEYARRAAAGHPVRTQYRVQVPEIRVTGIRRLALLRGNIVAHEVDVVGPQIRIVLDRLIHEPVAGKRMLLPHEYLLSLANGLVVDTLTVHNGRLRYFERAIDGTRFGRIDFDSLNAAAAHIRNRIQDGRVPIVLDVLVAGAGRMHTRLDYDFLTPAWNMTMEGGLGRADMRIFNPMLVDLQGTRLKDGTLDTVHYRLDIKDGVADGSILAVYHDLKVQLLDKTDRSRDLGDKFNSFMANHFKLHTSNPGDDDEAAAPVRVHGVRKEDVPLLKFVWVTLRQGIAETMNLPGPQ